MTFVLNIIFPTEFHSKWRVSVWSAEDGKRVEELKDLRIKTKC